MTWDVSEAQGRMDEILTLADAEAQTIVSGERDYIVIAAHDYERLKGKKLSFIDFLIDAGPRFDGVEPMRRNPQ